jgi:hypothetical protein
VFHIPGAGELTVFLGALVGACLGFLWFNAFPATVFMGDTGSLALGGGLGLVAVATRQELTLLVAGGVFVAEACSVILQRRWFRLTGGGRLFRCAPLHHHYQFQGHHEVKVTWLGPLICSFLARPLQAPMKLASISSAPAPRGGRAERVRRGAHPHRLGLICVYSFGAGSCARAAWAALAVASSLAVSRVPLDRLRRAATPRSPCRPRSS